MILETISITIVASDKHRESQETLSAPCIFVIDSLGDGKGARRCIQGISRAIRKLITARVVGQVNRPTATFDTVRLTFKHSVDPYSNTRPIRVLIPPHGPKIFVPQCRLASTYLMTR